MPTSRIPVRTPTRHPEDELLLDYATGGQCAAEMLMIETHLSFCPACRATIDAVDAIGGALLDALEPAPLPPGSLDRTLAAIAGSDDASSGRSPAPEPAAAGKWRTIPGGFRMRRLTGDSPADPAGAARVWLFDAPAGMRMFPHRHAGAEWTLVLSGLLTDDDGSYHAGDFIVSPDGADHRPRIGAGERCLSLSLVRHSPLYLGVLGRAIAPFIRL
jgi:putative transcriptional regulator